MSTNSDTSPELDLTTAQGLVEALERQAELLIAVATGGPRIPDVEAEYQQRRRRLRPALDRRRVPDPFPWSSLWEWYHEWSETLPSYNSRRLRIQQLIELAVDTLQRQASSLTLTDPGSAAPATWADLNGRVAGLANELANATSRDDLQDVGRRAREVLNRLRPPPRRSCSGAARRPRAQGRRCEGLARPLPH